jgi:hypothetical protein
VKRNNNSQSNDIKERIRERNKQKQKKDNNNLNNKNSIVLRNKNQKMPDTGGNEGNEGNQGSLGEGGEVNAEALAAAASLKLNVTTTGNDSSQKETRIVKRNDNGDDL